MRACKTRAGCFVQQSDGESTATALASVLQAASYAAPRASYASRRPASAASGGLGYYLCLPRALRPQRAGERSRAKRPKFSQLHAAAYGARFDASDAAVARLRCARAWRSRFLHHYGSEGVDVTARCYRVGLGPADDWGLQGLGATCGKSDVVIPSTMALSRVRRKRLALGRISPPVTRPKDRRFSPYRTRHAHMHSLLVVLFEATTTPRLTGALEMLSGSDAREATFGEAGSAGRRCI